MAAISIAIRRGASGLNISDYTIGTSAPGTLDFEFRYNTTDANSVTLTKLDLHLALEKIMYLLEEMQQSPQGTYVITAPPL